jgi:hypothetical protein
MQEKTPSEKKPDYPETGKQGGQGQGDIGKKGGDVGGDFGKSGEPVKKDKDDYGKKVGE